ncbi:Ribonuclease-like 3 [Channa argus]|uniref:Ribonuclease-like 3 n=1 Tax=Channa argus TaxID=215402 RepID=A0A6G1PER7_CHAAH|nr:Ribonuclease-like 3 [Channa argus]
MFFLHQETMKILFACVLLMLLSATVLSGSNIQPRDTSSATVFPTNETEESIKPQPQESYEKFKRQHINKTMTKDDCNKEISTKGIYNRDKTCKNINTFILADEKRVKKICNGEGKLNKKDRMTYSNTKFNIVVCKLQNPGAKKPNCVYKGERLTKRVVVKCEGGFPVHYQGDKLNFAE